MIKVFTCLGVSTVKGLKQADGGDHVYPVCHQVPEQRVSIWQGILETMDNGMRPGLCGPSIFGKSNGMDIHFHVVFTRRLDDCLQHGFGHFTKQSRPFTEPVLDDDLQAIRVFVSGGGCGGMGYGMTFTDTRTEYDYARKEKDFSIYVDAVALNYLRGVEIDYVERPTGASFVFNNAFAMTGGSGTCGACGAAGGGCA